MAAVAERTEAAVQTAALPLIEVPAGAKKVDVLLFTYRMAVVPPIIALTEMVHWARKAGIDAQMKMFGNALVHEARNQALAAIRPDVDYVLFVDDDMIPPHKDAIKALVDLDCEVVAPLFTTRSEPVSLTVKKYDADTDTFRGIESLKEATDNKVLLGPFAVGLAFTLVRRDAIEKVIEYHLSAKDWMDDNRELFDRLHVRAEYREKERARIEEYRRFLYKDDGSADLFGFATARGNAEKAHKNNRLGEDISFCRKLLRCGVQIALDCRLEMAPGHVGQYAFGIWDMGTPNNREEYFRALRGPRQ